MALEKSQIVRCGEHSDYGTITFLYQDDMAGLEVRAVDNSWIQATPRSGTILINVGDLLEIYSNGLFPATLHRVVIPGLLLIKILVCKLKCIMDVQIQIFRPKIHFVVK